MELRDCTCSAASLRRDRSGAPRETRASRSATIHLDTRHIVTTRGWFGGGGDLTAALREADNAADFHTALKSDGDGFDSGCYPRFERACDEHFFLPHRGEARGVGAIFHDGLDSSDREKDFALTRAAGLAFLAIYPQIIGRRRDLTWTEADRQRLLERRGRYVEFNLLYDRGTQFGLTTGGNAEAILMPLPPKARRP